MDELRRTGLAKMNEVYGWEMPNIEGDPYFDLTVDQSQTKKAEVIALIRIGSFVQRYEEVLEQRPPPLGHDSR